MGLLDRFRKEEKTHFIRDEYTGEVTGVEKEFAGKVARLLLVIN